MNFNLKFQKLKSNIQENDLGLHLVFRLGPEWGGGHLSMMALTGIHGIQ